MPTKKSFKSDISPAMQFISHVPEQQQLTDSAVLEETTQPAGFKKNPLYIETKSKRIQLLMQPSLHEKLKNRADSEGKSVNDLVHSILSESINA